MASFGTVQGKKKLPNMAAGTKGGPAGGKPIAPPVPAAMTAAKGRPTRVLTDAQRRRRTIRQALGIADVRKATSSQKEAARAKGGFLTRSQVRRQRTAVRPTSVTNTGTSYGSGSTMKTPKRRKSL